MSSSTDRICQTKAHLNEIGFEPVLTEETYQNIVAVGFDRRTLPSSFVLAQILVNDHPLSLRSAFYRATSVGLYSNTGDEHYRQCGNIVLKLRRAGIIPYSWIADSLRTRRKPSSWSGLEDFGESVRAAYRRDFWASQKTYVEIVTEKDAMAGTIQPVTDDYDVHLNVIRGNCSESHVWNWAEALKEIQKPVMIYYLGDFDPNGLDIERDLRERLSGFLDSPVLAREIDGNMHIAPDLEGSSKSYNWIRLAVTEEDFSNESILGFPVRQSASKAWQRRCADYISKYGDRCVEVDAIPPAEIRQRVRDAIERHIDRPTWERLQQIEAAERETITKVFGPEPH
jgi:hypothetical protein